MSDILLFALFSLFYLAAGIMLFIKYVHIFQLNHLSLGSAQVGRII
jgi:hypothetical protein